MKVCTDSCLFGAWMAEGLRGRTHAGQSALDVGAGTGLLSLMLAQETAFQVEAVEWDDGAAGEARRNAEASPFAGRVQVFPVRIQDFAARCRYDFVFSNPPFFESQLVSPVAPVNAARHDTGLVFSELAEVLQDKVAETGSAAVLVPAERSAYMEELLRERGFQLLRRCQVRQKAGVAPFRTMLWFGRGGKVCEQDEWITIRDEGGQYSERFQQLLRPYYLHL